MAVREVERVFCDECGKELHQPQTAERMCAICSRDLCSIHYMSIFKVQADTPDYRPVCFRCFEERIPEVRPQFRMVTSS